MGSHRIAIVGVGANGTVLAAAILRNYPETVPGGAGMAFFNRPNHLGSLIRGNRDFEFQIAMLLTDCGSETDFVEDIKHYVWKTMVMKCTMASICAVTNKTIMEALEFGPTKEIADACFKEAPAVARAVDYDIGEDYL